MYVSQTTRDTIRLKFGGKCAYSGTDLDPDWQIEHIIPVVRLNGGMLLKENDCLDNMIPVQGIINHYKHSYSVNDFRWMLSGLHLRIAKLPKNPRTKKGQKRKEYLLKVAGYFGITVDKPFSGKFYYELQEHK